MGTHHFQRPSSTAETQQPEENVSDFVWHFQKLAFWHSHISSLCTIVERENKWRILVPVKWIRLCERLECKLA